MLATLAFGTVMASGAELVTAEVTATANDVTLPQGSSVTSVIDVSATGQLACTVTAANSATATVDTAYSFSATGTLTTSLPSGAMNFYTAGDSGTNCAVTWGTAPAPYHVTATFTAASTTPIGSYTVTLSSGAGTTDETNPNASAAKLADQQATLITVHVVAPAKQNQTITFPSIASKTYGDADFDAGASATSGLPVSYSASGNCSIASGNVHVTGAGSCTVTASQSGNTSYNAAAPVSQSFTIAKANQTVTLGGVPFTAAYDDTFTPTATASSGLLPSITVSGPCTRDAATGIIQVTSGSGTCAVTASQAGDTNYNAAAPVTANATAAKATQTITFAALADKAFGDGDFVVSASASSGLAVSFAASGACTITGTTVHITGAGSCTITASQAGDANYAAGADVARAFSIAKASQSISFAALADKTYGDDDFGVSATGGGSGNAVTFTAAGDCTVSGATVQITGAGNCTITAHQAGNGNYDAAEPVARSFAIAKAHASLSLSGLSTTYNGSPRGATVTSTPSGLAGISITYDGHTNEPTDAGSYAVAATLDNPNYEADTTTGTLVIAKASQSISFAALADKTYGNDDFGVSASASSGLTVSLAASGDCTLSGATVHITGAGNCTLTASQDGNDNYNPAPEKSQSFAIAKANQTITFNALPNKTLGDPDFNVSASASSGLPVSFGANGTCTVVGTLVHLAAGGTCGLTASQAGSGNYNAAVPKSQQFYVQWAWSGFFQPIDNGTFNVAKSGSTIPVKFGLGGDRGLGILVVGSPSAGKIACTADAAQDAIEEYSTATVSGLKYDATANQYIYNWKTASSYAGTCQRLSVKLIDGTTHTADFKFTK